VGRVAIGFSAAIGVLPNSAVPRGNQSRGWGLTPS
jgi:hypothetical protein